MEMIRWNYCLIHRQKLIHQESPVGCQSCCLNSPNYRENWDYCQRDGCRQTETYHRGMRDGLLWENHPTEAVPATKTHRPKQGSSVRLLPADLWLDGCRDCSNRQMDLRAMNWTTNYFLRHHFDHRLRFLLHHRRQIGRNRRLRNA
jgi:hypothetical protein